VKVIIVGAGLGGLCLAQGLKQAGVDLAVHERDATLTSRRQGYRIHIDGRGAQALHECLPADLYELFVATSGRPSRELTVVTKNLRTLHKAEFSGSGDAGTADPDASANTSNTSPLAVNTSVDRSVLRRILHAGLADEVKFGHEFVRYQQLDDGKVRAYFADGTEDTGDVLVAADGVGSRIRAQYLPQAEVNDTGDRTLYGKTPLTAAVRARIPAPVLAGFTAVIRSRKLGMATGAVDFREPPREAAARLWPGLDLSDAAPFAMWALAGKAAAFPAPDEQMHAMAPAALHGAARELVADWHPDLRALVGAASTDDLFYLNIRTSVPFDLWQPSAITLLGDAIHAMPPSRGSGANIALKDAGVLCALLRGAATGAQPLPQAIPAAIGAYEKQMVEYGFAAVQGSLAAARREGGVSGKLASMIGRLKRH
jgi:2-polyprenyl-6-methoxyphenol hydroxylase-like FAD-dependent oxidoreductase